MTIQYPVSFDELSVRVQNTRDELMDDYVDSRPARILKSPEQEMGVHLHRFTVENKPPNVDPVEYDWSNRLLRKKSKLKRNGFRQTVQGTGLIHVRMPVDESYSIEWEGVVFHIVIVITDKQTNEQAYFDFGSWIPARVYRCADYGANRLLNNHEYEITLADRISILHIPNNIAWNVDFSDGWSIEDEVERVVNRGDPRNPFREIDGLKTEVSFTGRIETALATNTIDNAYYNAVGTITYKEIIDELAQLNSIRGNLSHSGPDGLFYISAVQEHTHARPEWVFDVTAIDSVVEGSPLVNRNNTLNAPNEFEIIGQVSLRENQDGSSQVEPRSQIFQDAEGIRRSKRVITEFKEMQTSDIDKLNRYGRYLITCELSDRFQISLKSKPLPHLWHNNVVSFSSEEIFQDTRPRLCTASEWELDLVGTHPQRFVLRKHPEIVSF